MYKYTDNTKVIVLGKLIDAVYKILCTYEEYGNKLPFDYLETIISEMNSSNDLMFQGELGYIIIQLNTLKQQENQNHKKVKKIVFDCANSLCRIRDGVLNG